MAERKDYKCADCGKQAQASADDANVPECCGKKMQEQEPLNVCEAPGGARSSRFDDLGEPCDDGRSGT
ncbi:MAG: hypothetical protein GY850_36990 [bacterium]|nr:hypothetical protein [bacterium]